MNLSVHSVSFLPQQQFTPPAPLALGQTDQSSPSPSRENGPLSARTWTTSSSLANTSLILPSSYRAADPHGLDLAYIASDMEEEGVVQRDPEGLSNLREKG